MNWYDYWNYDEDVEDGNEHTVCGSCVEKRIKEILKNEENKNG